MCTGCHFSDPLPPLQLPYSTVKSYFCGVMVFCQEQLAQTAHSMQHKASSGILADEVCVHTCLSVCVCVWKECLLLCAEVV